VAEQMGLDQAKIEATWDPADPIFTARERAALEMATLFSEDYHAISDEHLGRWKREFTDEELIELGAFMAFADGFGKLVEMLGLGQADQRCGFEV
jgi:alkylhydroperoxidase family enzyme